MRRGVAHIAGTADLGQTGNVGLAAHRDTYFRNLREITEGDTIHIATRDREYRYIVDWKRIVWPESVEVLEPTSESMLTLITCYPFHYVGRAPKRFVVRARHLDIAAPAHDANSRPAPQPLPSREPRLDLWYLGDFAWTTSSAHPLGARR